MKKYIFAIIITGMIILLPEFADAATLSLSPAHGSYPEGQIFTVNILLDTQSQAIDGVDIFLNYNPSQLEVQDDNGAQAGVQITAGSLMPANQVNSVDQGKGKITFSQITAGGTTFKSDGAQILATLHFKVIRAVNTSVSFDYTPGNTRDSNVASKGLDILASVVNGNYGPPPYCGDGACNGSETCSICNSDCGRCVDTDSMIIILIIIVTSLVVLTAIILGTKKFLKRNKI